MVQNAGVFDMSAACIHQKDILPKGVEHKFQTFMHDSNSVIGSVV